MTTTYIEAVGRSFGVEWFPYQWDALVRARNMSRSAPRTCLYYKTGSGKTVTALGQMAMWGVGDVLVVTPPSAADQWIELGTKIGMKIECISHAKFRQSNYKLSRDRAIVADEMHLFGGHDGVGWKKLDRVARGLEAPLVMASATPNYNDAERVYCIQHILDPGGTKGGFLDFIYANCTTEHNPYGMYPKVTGFHQFADAAEYLASLPGVDYLPDDLVYTIHEERLAVVVPWALTEFGLNQRKGKMIASDMEARHALVDHKLIHHSGRLKINVYDRVMGLRRGRQPMLVFAAHATVAEAFAKRLADTKLDVSWALVTGKTPTKAKAAIIEAFRQGQHEILIGTASLATGTDGLDKVCDTLVILDDTDDDSLRRQLIGRIMPRGTSTNLADKRVFRIEATL